MIIDFYWITGFMIGFEYAPDYEGCSYFVVDLGILRITISKPHEDIDFD